MRDEGTGLVGSVFVNRIIWMLIGCGLVACGGGSGTDLGEKSSESFIVQSEPVVRQALFEHMVDRYLWFDQLPDLDLADESNANLRTLIASLRKQPEDRFSSVVNAVSFGDRVELGVVGSYGVRFFLRAEVPLDLRVAVVDDFGAAGLAGVQRGDRVTAVNGVALDEAGLEGFNEAFSGQEPGDSAVLSILHPDGREADYAFARTEHSLNPVRKVSILESSGIDRRVAYVQVNEFIELTRSQLDGMRSFLSEEQPDELILDMRYNPGGLVSVSRDLASSLYGNSAATDVYTVLTRNEKHRDEDFTYLFRQFDNALNTLSRVFVLTTRSTCSAAEEVINGLAPFLDVVAIGTTTCGKPYAARPFSLVENYVIANVLESRSVNANGEGDFFAGLAPDCIVADDPLVPFGDTRDSLTAAALDYIRTDACPQAVVLADDAGNSGAGLIAVDDSQMPAVAIQ